MARPKSLPDGERVSITVPTDLLEPLRARAASKNESLSAVIVEALRNALEKKGPQRMLLPEDRAKTFPKNWAGEDLRQRLLDLCMRQKDLARVLTDRLNHCVTPAAVSNWILGVSPFPSWSIKAIQEALKAWDPSSNPKFRVGSRSPMTDTKTKRPRRETR